MKRLETERLTLREFRIEDIDDFYDYAKLETVGPNAGWLPHPNKEHSVKILEMFIKNDEVWAIELKSENKVIGSIGLHHRSLLDYGMIYEVGYVLSTKYEKQGFMSEALKRVLDFCFDEMGLSKLFVGHFLENKKSERLIKKFPFKYLEDMDYESRDYGLIVSKIYMMKKNEYINWRKVI